MSDALFSHRSVRLDCTYLPGVLTLEPGTRWDYAVLERFHYIPRRPATWADVWVVRYSDRPCDSREHAPPARIVGIAVLSHPVACIGGRQRYFGMHGWSYRRQIEWANAHVRTISRVIVHPQFRGIGLASQLVRTALRNCPTRYVEALAQMGRVHPFFERAGMTRIEPVRDTEGVYFIFDRSAHALSAVAQAEQEAP